MSYRMVALRRTALASVKLEDGVSLGCLNVSSRVSRCRMWVDQSRPAEDVRSQVRGPELSIHRRASGTDYPICSDGRPQISGVVEEAIAQFRRNQGRRAPTPPTSIQ